MLEHSVYACLWRWRGQMLDPPHSLHVLLSRWWAQMLDTALLEICSWGSWAAPAGNSDTPARGC